MKTYTYHNEIKTLLTQVVAALDNIIIKRVNENTGLSEDSIKVNFRYSPKSRTLMDLTNKNMHLQLPIASMVISNISYDNARAFNKIEGFSVNYPTTSANNAGHYPQPLPIKMVLTLSLLGKNQNDIDQLVTNIFAYFFDYIVISYKHPDLGHEVRCAVKWDGSLSYNYPNELQSTTQYRVGVDGSFTVLGWIYRNAYNPYGIIYNIDSTFTSVSALFTNYGYLTAQEADITTDSRMISGRPFVERVYPYKAKSGYFGQEFAVYGNMFDKLTGFDINGFVLRGTTGVYPASTYSLYNPLSGDTKLSSVYTAFSGVSVENWQIMSEKILEFVLPTPQTSGFIDLIMWNPAGIGKLTIDSVRPTTNPYVSGTTEYNNYIELQYPYISGIQVNI